MHSNQPLKHANPRDLNYSVTTPSNLAAFLTLSSSKPYSFFCDSLISVPENTHSHCRLLSSVLVSESPMNGFHLSHTSFSISTPFTEKNSLIILTNLQLSRRFRTKSHRSDSIPTDAVIMTVKHCLLHGNSKNL